MKKRAVFTFLSIISLVWLVSSCWESQLENDKRIHQKKAKYFESKFNEINEITPEDLCIRFYSMIENANEDSPFKRYTPEMIRTQEESIYRNAIEENTELVVDILIYKKKLTKKGATFESIQLKISELNNIDRIDKVALKAFELMEKYEAKRLEIALLLNV